MKHSTNRNSIRVIINKLKIIKNIPSDTEIAIFLGIAPQNLTNCIFKNSLNFNHIIENCSDIDLNWLLYADEKTPYPEQFTLDDSELKNLSELKIEYEKIKARITELEKIIALQTDFIEFLKKGK